MSRAFKLFRLQQVDSQLDQIRARLDEINRLLSDNADLKKAEAAHKNADKAYEDARRALNTAEANTRSHRDKIKETNDRLYGGKVRNPKELTDLQMESTSLQRFLGTLEDRQLEAMMALEEVEETRTTAENRLEGIKARLIESNAALAGEQSKLRGEAERLAAERASTELSIPSEDLVLYDKLRNKRAGIAVAQATDRNCSACGASVNNLLYQSARSPQALAHCDTCGRILYA